MSLHVSTRGTATRILVDHDGHTRREERRTVILALVPTAPGLARQILNEVLAEWGLGHLKDAADVITSELVTNALLHGQDPQRPGEPARLAFYTDREADDGGLLFVEVEDPGRFPPTPRDAAEGDIDGRGLLIVEALAEDWGTEPNEPGKRVWASLAIRERTDGCAP